MRSLLVISCSARKLRDGGLLPALQRYDGGTFRVIRKMKRSGTFPDTVDIKIISAEFGLIDPSTPIPNYDSRISRAKATRMRFDIENQLQECLDRGAYSNIYVDMGRDYLFTIESLILKYRNTIQIASGRIGERLGKLKHWLST